ncbi:related to oligosaccharide transporter [Rhynchosporium secalis]|uniref:Man(5)GlcNAc(2)-PP-dolichol translocation protein RFT1 n=1 Tax=Rhynchosporium secalis TaxID=38038 RepID=A0A1E1M9D5_RHYSE|nr:related to oligosaccharide transporter [Rhynchosporium secalis]
MSSKPAIYPAQTKHPSKPASTTSSAVGAALLIGQQFSSRGLTFIVNQILLRYLSPSLLGISTQLEVYSITVLFFARESLRVAVQRQPDTLDSSSAPTLKEKKNEKLPKGHVDASSAAGRTQAIVNLSYISICLGTIFAFGVGWLYIYTLSAGDPTVLKTPYFIEALKIYGVAAFVELLAEPCYVVVQQKSRFGIRASAELVATVLRCLITCGCAIWASRSGRDIGVLPFAIGQGTYAVVLVVVYYMNVWSIASKGGFSLLARKIYSHDHPPIILTYISHPLLKLTSSFFLQSLLKHLLTQGDTILIASLSTPHSQGIYALAANYGGLIARLLLQPIEEISRNTFGKLLSSIDGSLPSKTRVLQVRSTLSMLLRAYLLFAICIVAIGPTVAPLLLKIVAGERWTSSGAGHVLSIYCYYIPLLAINGLTEAFVSSVATKSEIHGQTMWMFVFSAGFAGAAVFFLKVLGMGAEGLVWANALNMGLRIVWSTVFIQTYLRRFGHGLELGQLLPKRLTIAAGAGTFAVLKQLESGFMGGMMDLIESGAVAFPFVVLIAIFERAYLLESYQTIRAPQNRA